MESEVDIQTPPQSLVRGSAFQVSTLPGSNSTDYGGSGGVPFQMLCEPNSIIKKIYSKSAGVVDRLGIGCDQANGKNPETDVFSVIPNRVLSGFDIGWGGGYNNGPLDCAAMCSENPQCLFSVHDSGSGMCWMKNLAWAGNNDWISSLKQPNGTMSHNYDSQYVWSNDANIPNSTIESCKAACLADSSCAVASLEKSSKTCHKVRFDENSSAWTTYMKAPDLTGKETLGTGPGGNKPIVMPRAKFTGGWGGYAKTITPEGVGFRQVDVRAAQYVDNLKFYGGDSAASTAIGGGGGYPAEFRCPQGQYLSGISGRAAGVVDQVKFHCGYPVDCEDVANVFSPLCLEWKSNNAQQYPRNVVSYCSQGNHMEERNCQETCMNTDPNFNCDSAYSAYCKQFTLDQIKADPVKKKICACFMDAVKPSFYSDFLSAVTGALPGGFGYIAASIPKEPRCLYADCSQNNGLWKHAEKTLQCPNVEMVTCVQNVTVGSAKVSDSAQLQIKLEQDCKLENKSPPAPTPSPIPTPTPSPSTPIYPPNVVPDSPSSPSVSGTGQGTLLANLPVTGIPALDNLFSKLKSLPQNQQVLVVGVLVVGIAVLVDTLMEEEDK